MLLLPLSPRRHRLLFMLGALLSVTTLSACGGGGGGGVSPSPTPRPTTVPSSGTGLLVFAMAPEGADAAQTDIYSAKPDGSNLTRLTTSAPDSSGNVQPQGSPALSPDRSRIVYVSVSFANSQSQSSLRLMNADGTNGRALSGTDGATCPTWSFDGAHVAFSKGNDGIYSMNADGTAVRQLTSGGANPSWNRFNSIAFNAAPGVHAASSGALTRSSRGVLPPTTSSYTDIYSMNSDGSGLKQLTQQGQTDAGLASINPSWSPDGKTLVFNSVPGSGVPAQLFFVNADGSNRRQLGGLSGTDAVWSPDGTRIAYSSEAGLSVVNADGTNPMTLGATDGLFVEDTDWR